MMMGFKTMCCISSQYLLHTVVKSGKHNIMDNESVMVYSHYTGIELGLIQGMELTQQETLGPGPSLRLSPVLNIFTLYYTFYLLLVPVPFLVSISVNLFDKNHSSRMRTDHTITRQGWAVTRYSWGRLCTEWQTPFKTLPSPAVRKHYVQTSVNMKREIFPRFLGIFYSLRNILACNDPPSLPTLTHLLPHSTHSSLPRFTSVSILHSFHWVSIGNVIERETILHWRSSTDSLVNALFTKDH